MSGPATVHRPIDCRKWSTDSKASSSLRSLFPISSKIAFDWISQSRGIPWFVCFFWMKYPEPFNRRGNRWNVVFRSYTNSRCTILFLRRYSQETGGEHYFSQLLLVSTFIVFVRDSKVGLIGKRISRNCGGVYYRARVLPGITLVAEDSSPRITINNARKQCR